MVPGEGQLRLSSTFYMHMCVHPHISMQREGVRGAAIFYIPLNKPEQGPSKPRSLSFLEAGLREDYKYLSINIVILVTRRNDLMISWMLSGNDLGGSILCSVHLITNSSLKSSLLRVRICHL